jgi:hypothetical protein
MKTISSKLTDRNRNLYYITLYYIILYYIILYYIILLYYICFTRASGTDHCKKGKQSHDTSMQAQGEKQGRAPTHSRPRHKRGWVVSVTPWPRFSPGKRTPGTHYTGGWVGPRAGLDTEKLSHYTPWRRMGDRRYSSYSYWTGTRWRWVVSVTP